MDLHLCMKIIQIVHIIILCWLYNVIVTISVLFLSDLICCDYSLLFLVMF
jgi:hypothetical protein